MRDDHTHIGEKSCGWTTDRLVRFAFLVIITTTLFGCAASATSRPDLMRQHFGFRPDEPMIDTTGDPCRAYETYSVYAQQLIEAYHSRASQNRGWIYVAGITGLGLVAASGGLAAAAAVSAGTLALLSLSGGFLGGTFAIIDNSDLAAVYTSSANSIVNASTVAENARVAHGCETARLVLVAGVAEASTTLESARTSTAVAAVIRAQEEQRQLQVRIDDLKKGDPTKVEAVITAIKPSTVNEGDEVTLTVANAQLADVKVAKLKVLVGSTNTAATSLASGAAEHEFLVKFKAPKKPDAKVDAYAPSLLVDINGPHTIASNTGLVLTYATAP